MFQNYDEIMQRIANILFNYLKEDFIEINLEVERPSGSSIGYKGNYINFFGDNKYLDFWEEGLDIGNMFHDLYQTMTAQTDKHKWNRV
jgi:hypothetical protein